MQLSPLDWASRGLNAASVEEGWESFFAEMANCGFENCSASVMKIGENVLTERSYGVVITPQFEEHVRANPEMTRSMELLVRFGMREQVNACTAGHPEFDPLWKDDMSFYHRMQDFGFKGGFGASLVDSLSREFTVLTASCFTSSADAIDAYDELASQLLPALTFLSEGMRVRELVEAEDFQPLSPREAECLVWVCSGLMNSAIAERTGLSEHTVREYLRLGAKKLGARTRAQAAARAAMLGLIKP